MADASLDARHWVTVEGVMSDVGGHRVVIVTPSKSVYSETFIHAHIDWLGANARILYGDFFPVFDEDDQVLLPRSLRRLNRIIAKVAGCEVNRVHSAIARRCPRRIRERVVRQYIKKNKIAVVVAEYGPSGVAMMSVCEAVGVPLVVHFHGFDAYQQETLDGVGRNYPQLFEEAAAIIVVSRHMEEQLLRLGAPRGMLCYNPYGVDIELFGEGDPLHAPPIFVAVGRFVDKKGPHLTLVAFRRVIESVPEAKLVMIGDGYLWEACKQLARALGIASRVTFTGPQSPESVSAHLRAARAFVQHSVCTTYGDSEGTPLAVLEASATGIPVVATRHGGIPDVVIEGKTGFLVEEGDVQGMAECMIRVAKDPELAKRLGSAARERVCLKFTMERSIKALWGIIEEAVHKNRLAKIEKSV